MKFKFSLKDKEASLEADVERLVEKELDNKAKRPKKRTRYQIKQEELRKNQELKHRQEMQKIMIGIGVFATLMIILIIGMIFEA